MNEAQQDLIYKYICSFADNGISLKVSLNEEIENLKENISQCNENKLIKDHGFGDKINKVSSLLDSLKETKQDEKVLLKVLQIQELCKELI